ncbi:MAG: VWA domain-containing protein [Bryobacterales bacterium]|nr:VWA domain-containing protein [Bryobacterales bacterium]
MARKNCLLPFFLAAGLLTAAPDDTAVFKSDVALVRVDAQVLDRNNRAVTGLHAGDFELRDEGRVQPIRNFASEEMPIDVLLLLDVSGSMRPHVERISSAAHQALQVLGKDDRVGIMVFDRSTRLRLPFRNSRDDVERALETLLRQEGFNGGTDITRAMLDAAAYVQRSARVEARRAIVILTDDETEFGRDDERVERALVKAGAVMSALIAPDAMRYRRQYPGGGNYPNDPYPQRYPRRGGWGSPFPGGGGPLGGVIIGGGGGGRYPGGRYPGGMGSHTRSAGTSEIARASGGDSMPVDDSYALETTLSRLRQRYALYFLVPPGAQPGQERHLELRLADAAFRRYPGAEIRFRKTYFAPGKPGDPVTPEDPNLVTQAPPAEPRADSTAATTASESETPRMRRRPAVDGASGRGPNVDIIGSASSEGPPSTATTSSSPSAPAPKPEPKATSHRGWRRVDEPAPVSGPIEQTETPSKPE